MKRIIFLDWLRIFAFTSVLVGHLFYLNLASISENPSIHESLRFLIKLIMPFCLGGGAGVVVFFLVSGYVIIYVLQKEKALEFAIKRLFRIYPLYLVALCLQIFFSHEPINFTTLIPQFLLIGDFFNAPNTLNGVEWTLRVEILFYLFMIFLRSIQVINVHDKKLPALFVFTTLILDYFLPSIPKVGNWNFGYLNIYGPFLFLGVCIWLYENKKISLFPTIAFSCFIFIQHWHMIDTLQPLWQHSHFAGLAFLLFLVLWSLRERLIFSKEILILSELTYPVYLLHNWLYSLIKNSSLGGGFFQNSLAALLLLFLIAFILGKTIEKPCIRLGYLLIQSLQTRAKRILSAA